MKSGMRGMGAVVRLSLEEKKVFLTVYIFFLVLLVARAVKGSSGQ